MAAAAACRPSLVLRCSTSWDSNFSVERTAHPARMKTPDLHLQVQRRCQCYDMFDQLVPYVEAWRWQKSLVDARCAALSQGKQQCEDTLVMLQHPPVYTMGTRSSDEYLRFDKDDPPFELHRTERGGEVTYHGPGQLVMYPILDLRRHRQDLHWYLRGLEEVVIRALWTACGLVGSRVEGLTGVWVGNAKVAAVGVRVSRWFTYHGLALNVNTDLTPFQRIVPCGIADRPVGSIAQILSPQQLNEEQSGALLGKVHEHLLEAFSDVFDLDLLPVSRPSLGEPRTVTSGLCDRTSTTM